MKPKLDISIENLHHAYLIESAADEGVSLVVEMLSGIGIPSRGNPDFHHYTYDTLLIADALALRTEQSFHGSEGARKIFVITFNTILSEAQNALLKTLEEPTAGTHFFFITKTPEALLPTVRSRMQVICMKRKEEDGVDDVSVRAFVEGDLAKRMEIITPLTKAKADEKPQAKEDARLFLESLERALYRELQKDQSVARALEYVLEARRALSERSPSLKALLEHIALFCPRPKSLER